MTFEQRQEVEEAIRLAALHCAREATAALSYGPDTRAAFAHAAAHLYGQLVHPNGTCGRGRG